PQPDWPSAAGPTVRTRTSRPHPDQPSSAAGPAIRSRTGCPWPGPSAAPMLAGRAANQTDNAKALDNIDSRVEPFFYFGQHLAAAILGNPCTWILGAYGPRYRGHLGR